MRACPACGGDLAEAFRFCPWCERLRGFLGSARPRPRRRRSLRGLLR